MTYTPKSIRDAQQIECAGKQLVVLAVSSTECACGTIFELMNAEDFAKVYEAVQPARAEMAEPVQPPARKPKQPKPAATPTAPAKDDGLSLTQALYDIVRKHGPLTSAEIKTRAIAAGFEESRVFGSAGSLLNQLKQAGKVKRVEHERIDKWADAGWTEGK